MPLYVCTDGLLAQCIYLGRRFLGIGLTEASLTGGLGLANGLKRLGFADCKQVDVIDTAIRLASGLYNTFLYLKQVLGNLAHISLVIL